MCSSETEGPGVEVVPGKKRRNLKLGMEKIKKIKAEEQGHGKAEEERR